MSRFRELFLVLCIALSSAVVCAQEPPPTPTPVPSPEGASPVEATPAPEVTPQPEPGGAPPQQASNVLNPNISVVGNLIGFAGNDPTLPDEAFDFSEVELALQAPIDPYARADVFVAVTPEGAEIEEAYVTWLTLPGSLGLKTGKFRSNFGKFNRTHPPETPFADRPLATERFFGEEGLSAVGVSASWSPPLPFYLNLDFEVTTMWREAPAFGEELDDGEIETGGRRGDLGYLLRASTYHDFSDSTNLTVGVNAARGVHDESGDLSTDLYGADLTFRWKDPRRAIYRSLIWQTEAYVSRREESEQTAEAVGAFSYVEYQFARRWRTGLRGDWTENVVTGSEREKGGLAYLTFRPSEFSAISLQGRLIRRSDGRDDFAAFLKFRFNMGPHGVDPF